MSYTIEHSEHTTRYMEVKLSNRLTAGKAEQFVQEAHLHYIGDDEELWGEYALDLYMSSPKNDVASMGDVYAAMLSGELKAPGVE